MDLKKSPMSDNQYLQLVQHKAQQLVQRVQDKHVHLAVTGLSGSGKTAFITSLVNQLLTIEQDNDLPLFNLLAEGRYIGAKILPHKNLSVAAFPYHEAIAALADKQPSWPASTRGISQISLAIKYQAASSLLPFVNTKAISTLYIDITDYPGEWLVDLPMLSMDYASWSASILSTLHEPPRQALAKPWLELQSTMSLDAKVSDLAFKALVTAYHKFLYDCRSAKQQLNFIQPGRAILPGDLKGTPLLDFVPWHQPLLDKDGQLTQAAKAALKEPDSLLAKFEARYEAYKSQVVKAFYDDYFKHFDKQLVLVDCLTALNRGSACYKDMQLSLEQILSHFNYHQQSWLKNLFSPTIKHLIIAASKADHVTPEQHPNLQLLLRNMLTKIRQSIRYDGAAIDLLAFASIKATKAIIKAHQGKDMTLLKGKTILDNNQIKSVLLFPGEVPSEAPELDNWPEQRFNFMNFLPAQPINPDKPIANIRMGRVLDLLLSEYFR